MKQPTLYKKTNTGAIQFWDIEVDDDMASSIITTTYGQLGTDSPQVTKDRITEGKNAGKKNATSHFEQAWKEAKSKWEKQKKKGYVETIESAEAKETDDLIEGGIEPMLAHPFSKHGSKITYPAYIQPKLDGIRCIAIVENGTCTLWSRTRKPIKSMPHIVQELEAAFATQDVILDGELYNHNLRINSKDTTVAIPEGELAVSASQLNFEKIVSLVRQEEPGEGHEIVQYHVYDTISATTFNMRTNFLRIMFENFEFFSILPVETRPIESEDEVMEEFNRFRSLGYEGAMLRNGSSEYVNKRSYDLQKVKEFDDAEFSIVGIEEGRGKLAGHVGSFVCRTPGGKEFLAKMSGETGKLKDYFVNHSLWQGKRLTVQYQGITGKEQVPRFPVGIAIRDYE